MESVQRIHVLGQDVDGLFCGKHSGGPGDPWYGHQHLQSTQSLCDQRGDVGFLDETLETHDAQLRAQHIHRIVATGLVDDRVMRDTTVSQECQETALQSGPATRDVERTVHSKTSVILHG